MLKFILTLLVVLLAVQAFAKDHEQKEKTEKESDDCTHCGKVFTKAFDSYANLTYTTQLEKLRSACESAPIRNRQALSRMCNGLVEKIEETKEELVDSDNHKAACKKLNFCAEHKSAESKHHNKDENKEKHHNKDENKHHNKDENKHHNKDENKENHHNKDGNKHHNKDNKNKNHQHNDENDKHHDKHKNKENHHGHHDDNNKNSACNDSERFTCFRSCEDVDRLMITRCPKISVPSVCVEEIGQWMCPVEIHGHLVIYTPEMYCPQSEFCEGPRQIGKVCVGGVYLERQILSNMFTPDNMTFFLVFASVSLFGLVLILLCRCIACCKRCRKSNNNKYKTVDPESDMTGLTEKL